MKNKWILSLLVFAALGTACDDKTEVQQDGPPVHHVNQLDILFVDESGAPAAGDDVPAIISGKTRFLDTERCKVTQWADEQMKPTGQLYFFIIPPKGAIRFDFGGPTDYGQQDRYRGTHTFRTALVCPEIFGDDDEHTLIILKKDARLGYQQEADCVLFDGRPVATDIAGPDDPQLPVKITVNK